MTVKQLTQSLTHVLIWLFQIKHNHNRKCPWRQVLLTFLSQTTDEKLKCLQKINSFVIQNVQWVAKSFHEAWYFRIFIFYRAYFYSSLNMTGRVNHFIKRVNRQWFSTNKETQWIHACIQHTTQCSSPAFSDLGSCKIASIHAWARSSGPNHWLTATLHDCTYSTGLLSALLLLYTGHASFNFSNFHFNKTLFIKQSETCRRLIWKFLPNDLTLAWRIKRVWIQITTNALKQGKVIDLTCCDSDQKSSYFPYLHDTRYFFQAKDFPEIYQACSYSNLGQINSRIMSDIC